MVIVVEVSISTTSLSPLPDGFAKRARTDDGDDDAIDKGLLAIVGVAVLVFDVVHRTALLWDDTATNAGDNGGISAWHTDRSLKVVVSNTNNSAANPTIPKRDSRPKYEGIICIMLIRLSFLC